jgi:hypothetical protein
MSRSLRLTLSTARRGRAYAYAQRPCRPAAVDAGRD